MSFPALASLSQRAATRAKTAARKARRLEKARRIAAKRTFVTASGEALTLPPRWTLKTLKAKLQDELNAAIRERDGRVCISSGKAPLHDGEWQAGHLFSVGAFPGLRFHPLNIHSQSSRDNCHLGGNHAAYSAAVIRRYGLATFEALAEEAPRRRSFTPAELLELLTVLRREGLAGYTVRYFAMTGWTVREKAA
jgi:hypothetical protein